MSDLSDTSPSPNVPPRFGRDDPEYSALHGQLRQKRGSAKLHPCTRCPKPAKDWARLHDKDGTDIWADYVPMCHKCHMAYDLGGQPKSDEHRAKMSEYAQNRTEEHRQKLSESMTGRVGGMTGKTHSEETKKRMRESQPNLGRQLPAETREKMRQAAVRRWAAKRAGGDPGGTGLPDCEDRQVPGPEAVDPKPADAGGTGDQLRFF